MRAAARPGQSGDIVEALSRSIWPPDGKVITDLASMTKVNWRALPSGMRSVYLEVSSRVYHGWSPTLMRRSHLTLVLPSQPGSTRRSG